MQPFLFHIDENRKEVIKTVSNVTGVSMAEVIRQMVSFSINIGTLNQMFPNHSGHFEGIPNQ